MPHAQQEAFRSFGTGPRAYTIDLVASREAGELVFHARPLDAPCAGFDAWQEKQIAITIAQPRRSRSQLFFNAIMPLAMTKRCDVVMQPGMSGVPLEADDFPHAPRVLVDEKDDGSLTVRAELVRSKAEAIDVGALGAFFPRDDIAFVGARAIRVKTETAGAVLQMIERAGALAIPAGEALTALRMLWAACGPKMLVLPTSYTTVLGGDLPLVTRATLVTPARDQAAASRRAPPFEARISFEYDGLSIGWHEARNYVPDWPNKRVVQRNRALESDAIDELVRAGFRVRYGENGTAELTLSASRLTPAVSALASDRFVVEADGFHVRAASRARATIQSGIDWFDVRAEISFGGIAAPMPEILAAVRRGDGLVRLGPHGKGILPSAWLGRLERVLGLGNDAPHDGEAIRFERSQVELVAQLLEGTVQSIDWDGPMAALRARLFATKEPIRTALPATPRGFVGELRPYQREGVAWIRGLEELGFAGCLADDMGLGKTIQVLAFLAGRKAARRAKGTTLVVAPRSLVHNWLDEARRFAPSLRAIEHRRGAGDLTTADLAVTTYAIMRHDIDALAAAKFDYVVLDEAHAIKNAHSATAKAARRLVAHGRLALTGTPVENHLGELSSLFEFLNPGMLGGSVKSLARAGFGAAPQEVARFGRGLSPFLLRRRKADVLAELPPRIEQTIHVVLGEEQRAVYDRVKQHYRDQLLGRRRTPWSAVVEDVAVVDFEAARALKQRGFEVLAALTRLRQLAVHPALIDERSEAGSAKMDALFDHLEPLVGHGKKSLVFSQFTRMLDLVERELGRRAIPFVRLDGTTSDRQSVVERFQNDDGVSVFLISLKAGGVGLNLTAAEYVFLLDPWWNPAAEAQAIDRAHRIGQKKTVVAYRLVCVDTIEDRLTELQLKKRELVQAVFGERDGLSLAKLTAEDLDALLT